MHRMFFVDDPHLPHTVFFGLRAHRMLAAAFENADERGTFLGIETGIDEVHVHDHVERRIVRMPTPGVHTPHGI
jgi:hypothetical protein